MIESILGCSFNAALIKFLASVELVCSFTSVKNLHSSRQVSFGAYLIKLKVNPEGTKSARFGVACLMPRVILPWSRAIALKEDFYSNLMI